ncbi:MAG: hypothetical protein ACE5HE_04670 [Phycisphaerae bacterium]
MRQVPILMSVCVASALVVRAAGQVTSDSTAAVKETSTENRAREILKKADAATKAVKLVSYKATLRATGALAAYIPDVDGTVIIEGDCPDQAPLRFRYEAAFTLPNSIEKRRVVCGSDGNTHYLIDNGAKTVYADIDPAVVGSDGKVARILAMIEYCYPTPFSDEINAEHVELKGTAVIGGEDCYEIHVVYRQAEQEANWFISKKDHLPRRVDRIATNRKGEKSTRRLTLADVAVNPRFKENPFKLVVPDGFTKADEFAPVRRRLPR